MPKYKLKPPKCIGDGTFDERKYKFQVYMGLGNFRMEHMGCGKQL